MCRKKQLHIFLITGILTAPVLLATGCLVIRDSPAPGCVKRIGFPLTGGCLGRTAILDLEVQPETECLRITVNNCNGGILEVSNLCDKSFTIGGVTVGPGQYYVGLDVEKDHDGSYSLHTVSSNFSDYVPEEDERIHLVGTLGDRQIEVSYIKTRELCD